MDTDVCLGLRLTVPFWCSFRDPLTSNLHRTFPVPPPSTLYGLTAAALGLSQDDYSRRADVRFGVAVDAAGEIVETYSKWMKGAEGPKDANEIQARNSMRLRGLLTPDEALWISTPLIRQKIIQPVFTVIALCHAQVAEELSAAFRRPCFPLYLGESDDVVDVEILGAEEVRAGSGSATGAISGVWGGGVLSSLPCRFNTVGRSRWEVTRWLVTVPRPGEPIDAALPDMIACHGHVMSLEPQ